MRNRLYVAGVVGGIAAVLVVAFLVFKIGRVDPSPPSLADHPRDEISGSILYVGSDDCVYRALASGRKTDQVICPTLGDYINNVTWKDAGTFTYSTYDPDGLHSVAVDIATKKETDLGVSNGRPPLTYQRTLTSSRGERVTIDPNGDIFRVDGARTRIFEFNGVDGDSAEMLTWSPDGEWIALYHARSSQIWIVRRDGSIAGKLADSARASISWWIDGIAPTPNP